MTLDDRWQAYKDKHRWAQLIDNGDWTTWFHHGFITLVGSLTPALIVWLIGKVFGIVPGILNPVVAFFAILCAWVIVVLYAVREYRTRQQLGWKYKRLDGIMDTLFPIGVASAVTWFFVTRL